MKWVQKLKKKSFNTIGFNGRILWKKCYLVSITCKHKLLNRLKNRLNLSCNFNPHNHWLNFNNIRINHRVRVNNSPNSYHKAQLLVRLIWIVYLWLMKLHFKNSKKTTLIWLMKNIKHCLEVEDRLVGLKIHLIIMEMLININMGVLEFLMKM